MENETLLPVRCRPVFDAIFIESVLRSEIQATHEKWPMGGPEVEARIAALTCLARSFALGMTLTLPEFDATFRRNFIANVGR